MRKLPLGMEFRFTAALIPTQESDRQIKVGTG